MMVQQRIETETPEADALGFTADLFCGWLELYEDCRLYLHYIISRNRNEGNTQLLLRRWISDGFDVRVVKPSPTMQHILSKLSFHPSSEYLPGHYDEEVEVWRRSAPQYTAGPGSCPAGQVDTG